MPHPAPVPDLPELPAPAAPPRRPARRRWTAVVLALLTLLALRPSSARADAFITDCSEAGLRSALGVGGRITFGCDGTIVISNTLAVAVDATLDGNGRRVILSGSTNGTRLFTIGPGVRFTAANLILAGGRSTNGGAIYNDRGFLTLERCMLTNNAAVGADGAAGRDGKSSEFQTGGDGGNGAAGRPGFGGAIYNRLGTSILTRCLVVTNFAAGGDGGGGGNGGDGFAGGNGGHGGTGARGLGGAIFNTGLLVVSNSTFQFNAAFGGLGGTGGVGGIRIRDIGGNEGSVLAGDGGHGGAGGVASGGAIYNTNRGRVVLYGSTFALNTVRAGDSAAAGVQRPARTGRNGAGAFGGAISNFGTNTAVNCTFFANRITGGDGGDGGATTGIEGGRGGDGGAATGGQIYSAKRTVLTNCTFYSGGATGGTNGAGGDAFIDGKPGRRGGRQGGNVANVNGSFLLLNCVIADAFIGTNGYGAFTDLGYNLSTDRSMRLRGPGSRTNTPAGLGSFGRNGGLTETLPLLDGSAAIDAGSPVVATAVDQRGVARPYGARVDIGAYEYGLTLLPPVITTQPQSVVAQRGDTVSFLAVAAGDPPLLYQWRRGSNAIAGATGPMLTVTNVQSSDAGTYDVIVSNNSGSVTSSGATLTLLGAVAITQQPRSQTVLPGDNAVFSVSASGDAPLVYQWYFRGAVVPGANLSMFTVGAAREVDSGAYHVVVANSFSSVTSAPAILTVGTNTPTIQVQPEDSVVDSGETAELSVVANGSQPLYYQWYRNGTEVVAGGTNDTLVITNAQPFHSGTYTVVVSNFIGFLASAPAELTVNDIPPVITTQPPDFLEPCYNDTVVLTVAARGTEPLFYQWYQDDVPLAGATNALLLLTAQTNQAGSYHVTVTNALGSTNSASTVILVTDLPRIVEQPASIEAMEGTNVIFRVETCAFPRPLFYQWYRDGELMENATNAFLVLTSIAYTNTGSYSVTVSNQFGTVDSDVAMLDVLAPFAEDCEFEDHPTEPTFCTLTVDALPGVQYTAYYFSPAEVWIEIASDALEGDSPGTLLFEYTGDVRSPSPPFKVIGVPMF